MKNFLNIIFFVIFFSANAQAIRPFFALGVDKSNQFASDGYINFAMGVEVKALGFLHPQIEAAYTFGVFNEDNSYDDNFKINSVSQAKFESYSFGCTPKILIYRDEKGYYSFNLLPKYTYSNVWGSNIFANIDQEGYTLQPSIESNVTSSIHSFGIGVGFSVNFSKKNYDTMAINIYLNNIEYGQVLNQLKNMDRIVNSASNVGFGLTYYFSLKNNIEKGFID